MRAAEHALSLLDEAKRCNHRRLLVIADEREKGIEALREILEEAKPERAITFTWLRDFHVPGEIEELKNSDKYMGTTYDFLALDLHHSLIPNDLGRLVGIVRGGGLVVLLTPPFRQWVGMSNYFHEVILTPPYTLEDVKHNFVRWLIRNLRSHQGVSILERGELVKDGSTDCPGKKSRIRVPRERRFPRFAYEMCRTKDQVAVLRAFERFRRGVILLTADRGRGKSSVLGMAAGLMAVKLGKVCITAPDFSNISEVFRFMQEILERRGLEPKRRGRRLVARGFRAEYREPTMVEPRDCELLIVDEAAGIPVPLLLKFLRARRVVYSTTVHGYEGTGRAFSIRFVGSLKRRVRDLISIEMEEPIRYSTGDPVEQWLFDTLLLNSEPPKLDGVDLKELEYRKYQAEEILQDEEKLREYYGIFVLAHYRNNPNDLGILLDAPNHEIRTLEYKGHVVCSVQLAREGGIEDFAREMYFGSTPPGNIVPDVMIKHHRDLDFGKFMGYRIVRIATHPDFMDMGIGSEMLKHLKEEGVDWLGSSFGATSQLVRFWRRNGFFPIHISPKMNESTGEYSLVVIHPLSREVEGRILRARENFAQRFLESLAEIHRGMEPDIAREILLASPRKGRVEIDDLSMRRLIVYAWGPGNYEVTMDVISRIARMYFLSEERVALNAEQEEILVAKVLQHRHWEEVGKLIGKGGTYVVIELREIMRRFIGREYYDEVSEFQRRFHGEDS